MVEEEEVEAMGDRVCSSSSLVDMGVMASKQLPRTADSTETVLEEEEAVLSTEQAALSTETMLEKQVAPSTEQAAERVVASKMKYFTVPRTTWAASLVRKESQLTTCRNALAVIFRSIRMFPWGRIARLPLKVRGRVLTLRSRL